MYTLAIGDRTYSSWSLRGWLLFERFGIPVKVRTARMYTEAFPELLKDFEPSTTVPAILIEGQEDAIFESYAIAETLHERHPDAGIWPMDVLARARARMLAAEMHAGFGALRDECTMNLEHSYVGFPVSDAVKANLTRLEYIWALAFERFGGPWLCGEYSAADVFFAPVATRIATYGLPVGAQARAYVEAHLADPSFRRWRALGKAENYVQQTYQLPYPRGAWPGPKPLAAQAVEGGVARNKLCPYSQKPIKPDSLAEIDGQIIGFCNTFCRDKSVADPAAWPALMELLKN